jgi:hypothetical protein
MIGLHCAKACISNQRFAQSQYFVLPSCSGVSADNKKVKGKKRSENGHKHIYST